MRIVKRLRRAISYVGIVAYAGGLHEFDAFLAVARYMGHRYLDEENRAPVGGYTTVDADLGYSWKKYQLTIDGTNLTNQRPPVTSSEFAVSPSTSSPRG